MTEQRPHRILVVTDHTMPAATLRDVVRLSATDRDVQIRLVVLNPARAEMHLRHPERRDKAAEAEKTLNALLPDLEREVGAPVIGSVSVRHDPMDAIEETVYGEPIDEIVLAVHQGHLAARLHQDLPHRLAHLELPVTLAPEAGESDHV